MVDQTKWTLASGQFNALREHIPRRVDARLVNKYHAVLDLLEAATGDDLSSFRIHSSELAPVILSLQRGRPGSAQYSKEKYCDDHFFKRHVDDLAAYLKAA
jgi:hypothetical protein